MQLKKSDEKLMFDRAGDYVVYINNISGKFTFDITASNVNLNIFGLFVGKNAEQFSLQTVQRHSAPNSISNLLIRGVFYDRSKFKYQGLIRIEKKGQKSHAYQKNQNLILSPNCFVESKPFLEILADDVYCTHGSTTGQLNADQLNYCYNRGLDKQQAEKLLVNGFIHEITCRLEK